MKKALLALGMIAMLAGGAWAQTGSVTGLVVDSDNNPVEGARVSLWQDDACVTYGLTDEFGAFTLTDVEPGFYTVKAGLQHVGQATVEDVEVLDGQTTDVGTLVLEGQGPGPQWQHRKQNQHHQGR